MWFDAWTAGTGAGAGATKIGAVVAAPAVGREALATPSAAAATAPASLSAGGGGGGVDGVEGVNVEVEVKTEGGGPIGIFGAMAGASAGSWIWPSLIWVTVLPRDGGRWRRMKVRRRRREGFVFVLVVGVGIFAVFCFGVWCLSVFDVFSRAFVGWFSKMGRFIDLSIPFSVFQKSGLERSSTQNHQRAKSRRKFVREGGVLLLYYSQPSSRRMQSPLLPT